MKKEVVKLRDVSMDFKLEQSRDQTLKGFTVRLLKRKLKFETFHALEGITFTVRKGDVIGIIGKNGAGKSTLLKIISGIMQPTRGQVAIQGNVVPMLELGSGFDFELTGRENIFLNGAILGYSKTYLKEKFDEIVAFSELERFMDTPIRNYSSGMMMRLAFSIATVVNPEILIVDEILSVGDASFQEKSHARMLELMGGGTTVFFVSHSLSQIRELCSRVIWLKGGRIEMEGKADRVCDAYEQQ